MMRTRESASLIWTHVLCGGVGQVIEWRGKSKRRRRGGDSDELILVKASRATSADD